jgi:hypothetical protein
MLKIANNTRSPGGVTVTSLAMRSCDELFIKKETVFTEAEFKQKLPEESVTYQRILKSAVQ